jgi:hypothetical protein
MLTYWEIQMQACLTLDLLGIKHEAICRLDLFRMRQRLLRDFKQHENQTLVQDAIFLLDELAKMRQMGFETRHKDGKYY